MTMRNKLKQQWPGGKPPQEVHDYVDWLLMPESQRVPATKKAYADAIGRTTTTLLVWEKDDRVKWIIQDKADKLNMSPERVQSVMNALFKKAESGDTAAAKLYLEHVDKIMPRKERHAGDLAELTDEELAEMAADLAG